MRKMHKSSEAMAFFSSVRVDYSEKDKNRFFAKTKKNGDCLEWTGGKQKAVNGGRYGGGKSLPHGNFKLVGRKEYAHRVAMAFHLGVQVSLLPLVSHSCDNPSCVNVRHLELSSHSGNLQEAYDRGRR
jgi:hypothetical protein